MSVDTTPEAIRVQRAVFPRMSGAERVEAAMEMAETAKEIAMAGIRSRNRGFNDQQVFRAWFVTLHGEDLAAQLLDADSRT